MLIELGVVTEEFKFPSLWKMTNRCDRLMADEEKPFFENTMSSLGPTQKVSFSMDEWEGNEGRSYFILVMHAILLDWSNTLTVPVMCQDIPYPRDMASIRDKFLVGLRRVGFAGERAELIKRVWGFTFDGAASNRAFDPRLDVVNLSATELQVRENIVEEFKETSDINCILHKMETFEKHVKQGASEGSAEFNLLVEAALAPGRLLYASNTNRQELRRVQQVDDDRDGRVKGIVKPGDTRWSHVANSMKREIYLEKYYALIDVNKTNFSTLEKKNAWNTTYPSQLARSNLKRSITTPFRAVNNAGDLLSRENYSCGGSCQTFQSRPGLKGLSQRFGTVSTTCVPSAAYNTLQLLSNIPSATCNVKYVYDSSDYIRYLKQKAVNQNYNAYTNGGDQSNASQVAWKAVRRY
jgi:hypothetical protein